MSKKNNSKYYYNRNQFKSNIKSKSNIKTKKSNNKIRSKKKMSKNNLKGHNPSGNSISADLSQFKGTSLEEASKLCKKFIPNENEFQALKHSAKKIMAQRIRYSAKKLNLFKPISESSKNVIFDCLKNNNQENLKNNISCIINAYNMFEKYELKSPKYEGINKDKVLQHLSKDFYKALDTYIGSSKKHAESKLVYSSRAKLLVDQYQILLDSLTFFYDYIYKVITEYIPNTINCDCVEDAIRTYDIDLCKYYVFDNINNQYVAISKRPLSKIEENYATYIICFCI